VVTNGSFTAVLQPQQLGDHAIQDLPRFIVQPGWKLRFAAEPLTRHLYDAHDRSMSWDVHVALTSLRTGVDKHHYFTHIDRQSNYAATADIVEVLGRALQ
jgi:hypothetical protein